MKDAGMGQSLYIEDKEAIVSCVLSLSSVVIILIKIIIVTIMHKASNSLILIFPQKLKHFVEISTRWSLPLTGDIN